VTTKRHLRDQVLRVLLGGPLYGSQVVDRLPDEDSDGVRAAVRRLVRDRAIVRGADKRLSIALSVDDLRALHTRLDADADRHARRVEHGRPLTATIAAVARKGR
jgi:hypothetical protein